MDNSQTVRLFVYGTLAPGQSNGHFLREIGGQWEAGQVEGYLYPQGIGPTRGYPALDLSQPITTIQGLLFSSSHLAEHWPELDAFEGEGYQRIKTNVTRPDGSVIEAFVYALDRTSMNEH